MKIFRLLHKACDFFIFKIFQLLKTHDNYIMLESEGDYTDNVKVFYDYLIEKKLNKNYKIIWVVHNPEKYEKRPNVLFISRYKKWVNWSSNYYAAVSKVFIFSHPYWLRNWKKDQIVINTSHSVAQLKNPSPPCHKIFDYVLCCSPYCKDIKRKAFYNIKSKQILELGMPRIDLLFKHKECIPLLDKNYNGEKIILSMQTFKQTKGWRDSELFDKYAINTIKTANDLLEFDKFLKNNNYKMYVKIHHLQDMSYIDKVSLDNIIYLTDEQLSKYSIQTNELLENADILLTDYSSVFYEFLIFNRPIGFQIGDINDYSRGFIMDNPLEEMPGKKIKNLIELKAFLSDVKNGVDDYSKEREIIKNKVFTYIDNGNCERLWRWINKKIKEDKK